MSKLSLILINPMKLFISYAHVDNDKLFIKSEIIEVLESGGHNVWFDENLRAGRGWQTQLDQQIADCDVLLLAMSPKSLASKYCQWEVAKAVAYNKPIMPVLIKLIDPLPDGWDDVQYVDFQKGASKHNVARLMDGLSSVKNSGTQPPFKKIYPKEASSKNMMKQILTFLSHPAMQGIGVIVAVVFGILALGSGTGNSSLTPTASSTEIPSKIPSSTFTDSPTKTLTPTEAFTNTPTATPATPFVMSDEETAIRKGPGAGFELLTMWDGRPLDILGVSADGGWYRVRMRDGNMGWVVNSQTVVDVSGNLSVIPTIVVTNTPTPVITHTPSPTLTLSPTPTHTPSPTLTLSHTPLVPPTATHTHTPVPPAQCLGTIPGAGGMLNHVKVLPNPSSPAKTPVQRGATVVILDSVEDFGSTWYQIEYGNNVGWINEDYVDVPSNCP